MTDTPSLRRSFRLVCNPGQIPSVEALLSAQGFVFEPEPFSPLARRLLQEPFPLGRSLAAFWGYVYIQDRSSMLPPLALAPGEGARVLDMCASPGSKTGLLAQLVGREGLVLGNEPARPRLANLRRNLAALNLLQAVTCSWPGESLPLPDASWDAVLLDPPCSGWGTTDKNPQAIKRWQGDRLKPMLELQRKLLTEASRLLRPGGLPLEALEEVLGTVAVDLLHKGLDLPGRQMLTLRGTALATLDLGVLIRIDKDVQRVVVREDNIGGPAHDDAVALLGEVLDDLALGHCHADGLLHDLEGLHAKAVPDGQRIGGFDALFAHVGHIVLVEAVFLGDHLDDLVVGARNAQGLGQTLAQLTAAGAKLTADGNDPAHS